MVYFVQILYTYVFYHCPATGMQNGDEALSIIVLAGQALLMKMLITLEPCSVFGSNFEYLCILTLSSNWYAKRSLGFTEHHFGRSSSFSENAHNSTAWYILFKCCILMYSIIAQPPTSIIFADRALFRALLVKMLIPR